MYIRAFFFLIILIAIASGLSCTREEIRRSYLWKYLNCHVY